MKKEVVLWIGAGQLGMAVARRIGFNKKIVVGDKNIEKAHSVAKTMNEAGFDVEPVLCDISNRDSILNILEIGSAYGDISYFINAANVLPSQASIDTILKVNLYGTAMLLEEVGKVMKEGGVGLNIAFQSGRKMVELTDEVDEQFATASTSELLFLDVLQIDNINDTVHAYQLANRCIEKRIMAEACKWGKKGARLNDLSVGVVSTPRALEEFNGPRGDIYKAISEKCPMERMGTVEEVASLADFLMGHTGGFITGANFLIDGGAKASYYYGELKDLAD